MPVLAQPLTKDVDSEKNDVESLLAYLRLIQACSEQVVFIIKNMLELNPASINRKGNTDEEMMRRYRSDMVIDQSPSINLMDIQKNFKRIKAVAIIQILNIEKAGILTKDVFEKFYCLVLQQLGCGCASFLRSTAKEDLKGPKQREVFTQIDRLATLRESQFEILKTRIDILCQKFKVGLYKEDQQVMPQLNRQAFSFSSDGDHNKKLNYNLGQRSHDTSVSVPKAVGSCCVVQ